MVSAAVPDRRCAGGTGWRWFCFLALGRPDNALRGRLHSSSMQQRELSLVPKLVWLANVRTSDCDVLAPSAVPRAAKFGRNLTCTGFRFPGWSPSTPALVRCVIVVLAVRSKKSLKECRPRLLRGEVMAAESSAMPRISEMTLALLEACSDGFG